MPLIEEEAVSSKVREKSQRAMAGTFRSICEEIGVPVAGRISVDHIKRDFSTLVEALADPDTLRDVNMALVSCMGVVAHPPSEREDLILRLSPLLQLQNHIQERHQGRSATLQLVIDTVTTLSHRPGGDSIMKAQVASLAFAQTLGEFGVVLPQPVASSEALLRELMQANDEAARSRQGQLGKQIPNAKIIHQQLEETDRVYPIEARQMTGIFAHVTADRRAIEVTVPTAALPDTDSITEAGLLAYRLYFVKQAQNGQWEAATMHEPVKTTEFDPKVHHITQTLGFWPDLPNDRVRYGLVVEQIGSWEVTQEKQAGKEKISTAFANPADEEKFLQAANLLFGDRRLFYESSEPNILTPFSDRIGQLLAEFREKGYKELLGAPMRTVGQYRTDKTKFRVAFCGRVGDQASPGNLIPLGLNRNARAGVANELMYTPDPIAEMGALNYADIAERRQILTALGVEGSQNSFEFFIHATAHVSEGSPRLDGRIGTRLYTRDLFTRPYTAEESQGVGSDTVVNLLEVAPVVTSEVTEGERKDPKEEFDTLGKLLAYYAALEPSRQGEIAWNCPQISTKLKELTGSERAGYRGLFDDSYLSKGLGGTRGSYSFGSGLTMGALGLKGFGLAGTDFGESQDGGKATLGSSRGVVAELDPIHIRLIVQY